MSDITSDTIAFEAAFQRLRQEQETFDQNKSQEGLWFMLRLIMGYTAVILLSVIAAISGWILLNSNLYSATILAGASAALFVDVLGVVFSVWKLVLTSASVPKLAPTTEMPTTGDKPRQIGKPA